MRQRARVSVWIMRNRHPRLVLGSIVLLSGFFGLFTSFVSLQFGLSAMWVRYPIAVSVAYAVFVGMFWLWLRSRHDEHDAPDLSSLDIGPSNGPQSAAPIHGQGGEFAGGGASGDFSGSGEAVSASVTEVGEIASPVSETAAGAAEVVGSVAAEGCAVVALFWFLLLALGAVIWWLLSLAPVLATEVVIDAVLVTALYRRLRRADGPYLLQAILRRSRTAFIVTAVAVSVAGAWMNYVVPQARTVGEFWVQWRMVGG